MSGVSGYFVIIGRLEDGNPNLLYN